MPDHHLKTALLAAIKPEGSTTLELAAATGINRAKAVKLLSQMQCDGLLSKPVKHLTTWRWTHAKRGAGAHNKPSAIPESECENQDLINS